MHELAAFVVSFILSGRRLTVRLFPQQAAIAHMAAATTGLEVMTLRERVKTGKGRKQVEQRGCVVTKPSLRKLNPWAANVECDLTLT